MIQVRINGMDYSFNRPAAGSYSNKFNRMVKLATRFEELDVKFSRMISRGNGVSETARLALACRLMLHTGIRIGNEGSAEGYMTKPHPNSKQQPKFVQTYGLTTLLPSHVVVGPHRVCLNFVGKKQIENSFILTGSLAKQVKKVLTTAEQFETLLEVSAYELTKFVKQYVGVNFMPKDFRTLRANMVAWEALSSLGELPTTRREANAEVRMVAEAVSTALNNTVGVCKKSYVDDMFWEMMDELRPVTRN